MNPPTATVSVSRKVNLGNYESTDVFVSVSGISTDTSAEDVELLLAGPIALSYDLLSKEVAKRALALKGAPSNESVSSRTGGQGSAPPLSVLSKPKRETSAPKPPRLTKIEAMKAQELAIFEQLGPSMGFPTAVWGSYEGGLMREALRVKLMGPSVFDVNHEPALEHWLQVLTKYRDEVLPVTEAGL